MPFPEIAILRQNLEKEFPKWKVEDFGPQTIRMTSRKDTARYIYFRYTPKQCITFADLSKTSKRLAVLQARRYGVYAFNEYNPDDPVFDYK